MLLLVVGGLLLFMRGVRWRAVATTAHTLSSMARWRGQDWVVVGGAALVVAIFLLPCRFSPRTIFYTPYPTL